MMFSESHLPAKEKSRTAAFDRLKMKHYLSFSFYLDGYFHFFSTLIFIDLLAIAHCHSSLPQQHYLGSKRNCDCRAFIPLLYSLT